MGQIKVSIVFTKFDKFSGFSVFQVSGANFYNEI